MITYRDYQTDGVLSITEYKDEPRFLDILNNCELKPGNNITVTIEIENTLNGKQNKSKIQFNRQITDIKNDTKNVKTTEGDKTLVAKNIYIK